MEAMKHQNKTQEQEMLAVSFGTSYKENCRRTIGAIEGALKESFPEWTLARAFTSQRIINHIKKRDDVSIDNMEEAFHRAKENGVKRLIVQPTLIMDGIEYQKVLTEAEKHRTDFHQLAIGKPLLSEEEDFHCLAGILTEETKRYEDKNTAFCFMGHGTQAQANQVYERLQKKLWEKGYANYFIGTVEAEPDLPYLLEKVKAGSYARVVLMPLMIVAGDHASNDMAGEKDSWKTEFESQGCEVTCLMRGLGELPQIHQMFINHVKEAMKIRNDTQ
ncbi:MAG: sirohydrochlorin cobaltochelatase [Lachnospiraceae bacterium]|nr:sirohydrochlorin cobaltochelatase [Lachnospiraceae bacterium]